MSRLLKKVQVLDLESKKLRFVADDKEGIFGTICWSPDGQEIFFCKYLPKDDQREKMRDKSHGLAIWAVGREGKNPRFVTTGWSPDFPQHPVKPEKN